MNIEMARREDTYQDVNKQNENGDDGTIDTTVDFLRIFQGKTEFDSWEEFSTLFENFQKETGSAFKPKSVTSIEYANERRMKDKIADRFVYQSVRMVCQHYGNPIRKESSTRDIKKYVGLGCEAMVQLRYRRETLNIVGCNLEHRNHKLFSGTEVIRNVRSFSFTDDIDFLMAKTVLEHKPFSTRNSEKEWVAIVQDLQSQQDPRMKTVNIRVVKKRIRFLVDRYMANSNGKPPVANDEMGVILYELAQAKQDAMEKLKSKQPTRKSDRCRSRKKEKEETDEDEGMDDTHMDFDDSPTFDPGSSSPDKDSPNEPVATSSSFDKDISTFFNYMKHKDEQDRKLRQHEVDLRREELELHKKELELHKKELELTKEKFEFDRIERQTHLELLKKQLDIFGGSKS